VSKGEKGKAKIMQICIAPFAMARINYRSFITATHMHV